MFEFSAEQKTMKIGDTYVGGKMGAHPTVLVGSIFYYGDSIVSDHIKGIFDKAAALQLLKAEAGYSLQSGNPRIVDVVAETEEAMLRYLDFIIQNTTTPFFVDSSIAAVRLAGIRYCAEQNVLERAVYNTIEPMSSDDEYAELAELGVQNVVILAFTSKHLRPDKRFELLTGTVDKNGENSVGVDAENKADGLIAKVQRTGAQNILIDPGVLDLPSSSWTAYIMRKIKDELGYPVGCAPSNALYTWLRHKDVDTPQLQACGASVFALPIFCGGDFLLYGPLHNAAWVYPSVSVVDAMIGYGGRLHGVRPETMEHPLFKLFQ
ncbi:MAG: hypothetical protein LBU61_03135 [Coriobacteriales bacterium]|jgi:tetrahydromethanopterin S-methyltransferase subunit H|nr:hypothetical protein [Coriobacteriales bacterium]